MNINDEFIELQRKIVELVQTGNREALTVLLEKEIAEHPDKKYKTSFWYACLLAQTGETEKATSILKDAVKAGIWWGPQILMNDQDLEPLYETEFFKYLLKYGQEMLHKANETTDMKIGLFGNDESSTVVTILHGRNSNMEDTVPHWLTESLYERYFWAFPQSSQMNGTGFFHWDNLSKAHEEIKVVVQKAKYPKKKVVLGGFSQGAAVALREVIIHRNEEVDGLILISPAIKNIAMWKEFLKRKQREGLKIWILIGTKDPFEQDVIQLAMLIQSAGYDCDLTIVENLTHGYSRQLRRLLEYKLQHWF